MFVGKTLTMKQAYYCENIGSPCLEYMLCANALRLAVSKGLHRQSNSAANLSHEEQTQRNLVFWAAYCLEKHIVSQSGRPSVCAPPLFPKNFTQVVDQSVHTDHGR